MIGAGDWRSEGCGGLKPTGPGAHSISGMPARCVQAHAEWAGKGKVTSDVAVAIVKTAPRHDETTPSARFSRGDFR